ncbi:armadillo-type protein [Xylogone sp. PMI_703]|nr:armadillo-type protein [Xylogone sp. PMI_703]
MPKEHKKRGRREQKKLKRSREDAEEDVNARKRHKSQEPEDDTEFVGANNSEQIEGAPVEIPYNGADSWGGNEEENAQRPFYGNLEDEEQEYFRHADELLELNDFPSDEDRSLFLANVYREAEGKELKLACSQSCSRLMERLILLSNTEQKKKLFGKFSGNFLHLVQHRFASHCCETLFIRSAPIVTQELTGDIEVEPQSAESKDDEVYVSMENLFLYTLNELEGHMTALLTDRFASHTLRVLLIVLSGKRLEKGSTRSLLQSKKKEKIGINHFDTDSTEFALGQRSTPESFQFAVEKIISDTVATMDKSFIRVLATHPTGNPSLQLLLELELTNPVTKKSDQSKKTIISVLLPDDIALPESESATFVNGIIYDPIGSRLLETIVAFAPGKLFKQIYRITFKDRIAALSRNEIASYVVLRVLDRLSKEDLQEAVNGIIPQVANLVSRSRTIVIKKLFERCQVRNVDTKDLTTAIAEGYGSDPSTLILKMAEVDPDALIKATSSSKGNDDTATKPPPKATATQLHGSLLAQTMLSIPGPSPTLLQDSILTLSPPTLIAMSLYTTTSRILQTALIPTETNLVFRRKLINALIPPEPPSDSEGQDVILRLALSPTGAYVLDSLLTGTKQLFLFAERIAGRLAMYESLLRDSYSGRIVWKNWMMDLYKRRRGDWIKKIKGLDVASKGK